MDITKVKIVKDMGNCEWIQLKAKSKMNYNKQISHLGIWQLSMKNIFFMTQAQQNELINCIKLQLSS